MTNIAHGAFFVNSKEAILLDLSMLFVTFHHKKMKTAAGAKGQPEQSSFVCDEKYILGEGSASRGTHFLPTQLRYEKDP